MATPQDAVFGIQFSVYISGVYMPASSVTVTTAFNAVPQCTVALPAYPELYGIGRQDRVPVHVFFLDNFTESPGVYKTLFEGVIIGFGYFNNAVGRSFVIQCEGVFNILHKMYVRFLTTLGDLAMQSASGQSLSEFSKQVIPAGFPYVLFTKDGSTSVSPDTMIDYPTQFLDNALKFIQNYSENNSLAKFYKTYLSQIKATDRYDKLRYFDDKGEDFWGCKRFPTLAYMTDKVTVDAIIGQVGAWGQKASMYELICGVMDKMEYEFSFITSPMYKNSKMLSTCLKPIFYDALPPKCNVMFRSASAAMQANENISDIATRIRADDVFSAANRIFNPDNEVLQKLMTINCYPTDDFGVANVPGIDSDQFAKELLASEEYTGPKIEDVAAPEWWSYINSNRLAGESEEESKKRFYDARAQVLKNLLMKKRYEGSRLSINVAFNPYITAGFPGVIFDNVNNAFDDGFCFIGHVLAVSHDINKTSATTSVELGFVRTIKEEKQYRLKNTLEMISDKVTNKGDEMCEVYQSIIGCDAVNNIEDLEKMLWETEQDTQSNPQEAYWYNKRAIATQEEFMETFMGFKKSEDIVYDEYRNKVPTFYNGKELLTDRNLTGVGYHPDYIKAMKKIQSTEVDQTVYDY